MSRRSHMRRWLAGALGVSAFLLGASPAAAGIRVTEAGGVAFPERALLLSGQGIPSLSPADINITENGVPVQGLTVRSLRRPHAGDFGVVVVIDISPDAAAIEHAVTAARDIASQRPPEQQLGIVEADATPPVALPLTGNGAAIAQALSSAPVITHHGYTIYQAALAAVQLLARSKIGAGDVIVLSDGADRGTPQTLNALIAEASRADVELFGVGIQSKRFDPVALQTMARLGGGQFYEAQSSQVGHVFDVIEANLESQYLIHYYSLQGLGKPVAASIRIAGLPGAYNISYTSPTLTAAEFGSGRAKPSFWTSTLALLLVAVVAAMLLVVPFGAATLRGRRRSVRERVSAFLPPLPGQPDGGASRASPFAGRLQARAQRMFEGARWWETFKSEVDIAQIEQSPIAIVFLSLSVAALVGVGLTAFTGSAILGLLGFVVCPVVVRMLVRRQLRRQQRRFADQLAELLQEVGAAMRAGRTLVDALAVVTEYSTEPARREFELALADERLGLSLDEALAPIARRMENEDMPQVALVAALDRRTGASTSEVLDRIAEGVRENAELARELTTLTAQARLSRWILCALPLLMLVLVSLTDPSYEHPLFHTTLGIVMLGLSAAMVATGSLVMTRVVKVRV